MSTASAIVAKLAETPLDQYKMPVSLVVHVKSEPRYEYSIGNATLYLFPDGSAVVEAE